MRFWLLARIRAFTVLTAIGGCLAIALQGCAPALNWRDVAFPDAQGLKGMFPCKPDMVAQRVSWPGVAPTELRLWSCRAGGYLWGVSSVTLTDVAEVPRVLNVWADALQSKPGYHVEPILAPSVKGSTPVSEPSAWYLTPAGVRSSSVKAMPWGWSWHFSHGLTIFQASVWSLEGDLPTKSEDVVSAFKNGFYFQN